jgi:hypothetical protein
MGASGVERACEKQLSVGRVSQVVGHDPGKGSEAHAGKTALGKFECRCKGNPSQQQMKG